MKLDCVIDELKVLSNHAYKMLTEYAHCSLDINNVFRKFTN